MIIYKATNIKDGKIYVGQTVKSLEDRKKQHWSFVLKGSILDFAEALREYGLDGFVWEVVQEGYANQAELNEAERYYIKFFHSKAPNGYNMTDGGQGVVWNKGLTKETDERVRKNAESLKGRKFSDSHKKNISYSKRDKPSWNKGVPCKESTKKLLSEFNKGKVPKSFLSEEVYQEIKEELAKGSLIKDIISKFRVSNKVVSQIRNGKRPESLQNNKALKCFINSKKLINDDLIRKIKYELSLNIYTQREIGKKYGINEKTISRIKRGKHYKFIIL